MKNTSLPNEHHLGHRRRRVNMLNFGGDAQSDPDPHIEIADSGDLALRPR